MKKILLALTLAGLLLPLASSATTVVFDSVSDFSDTQGGNGWSYAGILSTTFNASSTSLWDGVVLGTYDSEAATWDVGIGGVHVYLSSTQQNYTLGTSRYSVRYWTADQAYQTVSFSCEITPVSDVTVRIFRQADGDSAQVAIGTSIYKGGPYDTRTIAGTITDVAAGERIYLVLSNVGGGSNSNAMQTVELTLTATTIPESSSSALIVGFFVLSGMVAFRRKGRR